MKDELPYIPIKIKKNNTLGVLCFSLYLNLYLSWLLLVQQFWPFITSRAGDGSCLLRSF